MAKPTEVEESEPEEDYVSELPTYNLPTKREKTDLEQFDTPEKMKLQKSKSKKIEQSPEWEKLKKKPENEKDPHGFLLGKGSIPGKQTALYGQVSICFSVYLCAACKLK